MTQLREVAPLSAECVLSARADKTLDAPVKLDELERAVASVPREARVLRRVIERMTNSVLGAKQGSLCSGVVAAAVASLHAVQLTPVSAPLVVVCDVPRVFGRGANRSAATSAAPVVQGVHVDTKAIASNEVIEANDKLVTLVGREHTKTLMALTQELEVSWNFELPDPHLLAARPDGSVIVHYREPAGSASYYDRVLMVSADGVKGRQLSPDIQPKEIVCGPDGAFYIAGHDGIEAYDANGDLRWKFGNEENLSRITLDERGCVHVSTNTTLLVLDDKGEVSTRHTVTSNPNQWNAPLLGSKGTTYLMRSAKAIDIVASDGTVTAIALADKLVEPPLVLSDGRLVLTHAEKIAVVNADLTPAWSSPLESNPSRPIEAADGTLLVHMASWYTVPDARQQIASFSPTGVRMENSSPMPRGCQSSFCHPFLTKAGRLVASTWEGISIFE